MSGVASVESSGVNDPEVLQAIAGSVRGAFQTVEDMTQSFIREAIVQGVFPPGQRLNLDLIASTLGVSRMPVRASLRQLESEGLLTIHPYRGATVSVLDAHEIAEIYELRILLEGYLIEQAIPKLDDAALAELRSIVDELEATDELGARLELRDAFYAALYNRAERPRAVAQVTQLRGAVGRYLLLQRVEENPVHGDFFQFVSARDVHKAKAWLAEHLALVSTTLQQLVSAAG